MDTLATGRRIGLRVTKYLMALAAAAWISGTGAQMVYLGTALTGLWSTVGEPGWGLTATHEEPAIFLTFFIYRGDTTPYWVTATLTRGPDVGGAAVYLGDLYETRGPGIGVPFNPTAVTYRKVGEVTFVSSDLLTVTLTYVVDGVLVIKTLTRFTLHNLDFSGAYAGARLSTTQNCSSPSLNGRTAVEYGAMTVTHTPGTLRLVLQGASNTCTFLGRYLQLGSWGNADGNHSCSDGTSGPLTLIAMQRTVAGFTAAFAGNNQQCEFRGTISGIVSPY